MKALLLYVFGCMHNRTSFPQKPKGPRRPAAALVTGHYVACLDCGKELPYDWQLMRVLRSQRSVKATRERLSHESACID